MGRPERHNTTYEEFPKGPRRWCYANQRKLKVTPHGSSKQKNNELRQISVDFLQIAKEEPNANDAAWCKTYEEEINEICEKLKEFLAD